MKKFWNWTNQAPTETEPEQRILTLNGTIAEESWFDDDITPQLFREELNAGSGDITVWINSPGGDCVAAAQIYNMLMDYRGSVTVKIDGIAASAASVIAMAGTRVLVSPVSMLMIHNPASASRPSIESKTKEDTIEPGTETLSLTADPRSDGLVKSRTGDTTDKATYDGWYQTVYIPDETEG